ncbi:unnamed protein product [Cladocopium goreaui]|uniref:CCHC-type domain-containing protein n=1 Tax=Cladocopium goreaui TaxID=2562237 RepID=A0A9P1G5A4_9DINO|nr:unnamed protein product [Cladocopium goreaui]
MFADEQEHHGDNDESVNLANHEDWTEDDLLEALIAEGDDDAVFIADFETAASELVQGDEDLAAAYSTYMEARRKLSEKYRSRGFWPISKGKAKGRGKSKGRAPWGNRKSLQQRIMESNCRLCGKKGHWRNECPMKGQSSSTSASAAVTATFAAPGMTVDDAMPAEFLSLPEVAESQAKDILSNASCFVQIEQKLRQPSKPSSMPSTEACQPKRILRTDQVREPANQVSKQPLCSKATDQSLTAPVESPMTATASTEADMFFATHDTWGIVDTGATKTVMGSSHVKEFLENLHPQVKPHARRSSSNVVFRFGNQGTLKATHALVVPGLYLMNMNDLLTISPVPGSHEVAAETYAQDDHSSGQKNAVSQTSANIKVPLATTAKISDAPRLTRAQANLPAPEQESIEHLTKENLKDEVMSFGKSHLGKTYEEMWVCHPDWIRWFTAHYHNSTKLEHRKMIHYIGLKIEESEANEGHTQPMWNQEIDTEIYEMMSESPWVNETQTREEIQNIQERMTGLETAMQRMIALMSQGHMMQPQPMSLQHQSENVPPRESAKPPTRAPKFLLQLAHSGSRGRQSVNA